MPKSYLTEEEKAGRSQNSVFLAESAAADRAGDFETSWEWLALAELPADALLALKRTAGAELIRERHLRTETADAVYGADWLDRDISYEDRRDI